MNPDQEACDAEVRSNARNHVPGDGRARSQCDRVRTADLDQVSAAAGKVLAHANVSSMKLEAFKQYYAPDRDIGVAGIAAKPTFELIQLQQDLIAAVAPFTVETGDSSAFSTTPDDRIINPSLID